MVSRWSTGRHPRQCKATVGADMFRDEVAVGGAVVSVVLWDTGDALQLQRLGAAFFHRSDCVLLLADLLDPGTALTLTVASWLSSLLSPGHLRNTRMLHIGKRL